MAGDGLARLFGGGSGPAAPPPIPAAPNPKTASTEMDMEAQRMRKARGAQATLFGGRSNAYGTLDSGSGQAQRMMLGS